MTVEAAARIVVDRSPELMLGVSSYIPVYGPTQTIPMTPEDMAEGIRGDAMDCPIARMLLRVPGIIAVNLSGRHPTFTDQFGNERRLVLPAEIAEWIGRFDRGEPVEPLNVILST